MEEKIICGELTMSTFPINKVGQLALYIKV
jgi:hypothetical protein